MALQIVYTFASHHKTKSAEIRLEGTKMNDYLRRAQELNLLFLLPVVHLCLENKIKACNAGRRHRICVVSLIKAEFGSFHPSESEE